MKGKPYGKAKRPAKRLPKDNWMDKLAGTLPRVNKRKLRKVKPSGPSEASIQNLFEAWLNLKGLRFFHVPDAIYQLCSPHSRTPIHIKKIISDSFKGLPDVLVFVPDTYKIGDDQIKRLGNYTLMIELKKLDAKARKSQLNWHKGLHVHVKDTLELAIELTEEWLKEIGY